MRSAAQPAWNAACSFALRSKPHLVTWASASSLPSRSLKIERKTFYGKYECRARPGAIVKNIHCCQVHRFMEPFVTSNHIPADRDTEDQQPDQFCSRGGSK